MKTLEETIVSVGVIAKGGAGSGNFGHSGRPGERGGSGEGGGREATIGQHSIKPLPDGRKWIEHVQGMPTDTLSAMKDSQGKLTPARQKLHDEIKAKFQKDVPSVPADQQPTAIVMMDGPASGKSSMVRNLDAKDFVRVDTDAIREHLPEYQQAVKAGARDAALITHEEASLIGQQIKNSAIDKRQNIIFDGTGKNPEKYEAMIKHMRENNYNVTLMMPVIDKAEGERRVATRAAKSGRDVPQYVIDEGYSNRYSNFDRISKTANQAIMFDNMGDKPRPVFERSEAGGDKTHDAKFVESFRASDAKKS